MPLPSFVTVAQWLILQISPEKFDEVEEEEIQRRNNKKKHLQKYNGSCRGLPTYPKQLMTLFATKRHKKHVQEYPLIKSSFIKSIHRVDCFDAAGNCGYDMANYLFVDEYDDVFEEEYREEYKEDLDVYEIDILDIIRAFYIKHKKKFLDFVASCPDLKLEQRIPNLSSSSWIKLTNDDYEYIFTKRSRKRKFIPYKTN